MRCIHEADHPGGCGTGPFCRACEAAIAIVASQTTGRPVERDCVISVTNRKGHERDLVLSVRASPFELKGEHFTVFCMTDIGVQKLYLELEHSFLHDLSNLAMSLCASSESLSRNDSEQENEPLNDLRELTQRLSHEITVQRLLLSRDPSRHRVNREAINLAEILRYLQRIAALHPCAQRKRYLVEAEPNAGELVTDSCLLERVLANMLINAFEATEVGGEVHLKVDGTDTVQRFAVHNASFIPPAVAARIFHRHFSTKQGSGRGQGTYAMRLLAETLLQGKLGFSTDAELGTTFCLELPLNPQQSSPQSRRI
jgi:K+-sensing histidine kinase KdpD